MTSHKYLAVTFTIILGFLTINTHARSWDLAIVVGREIEFFAQNKTLTGQAKLANAVSLEGVAYDDVTRTMYFADPTNENMTIYSSDLTDKNFTAKPLFKRQNKSHILGLAFDTTTRTLFWSDTVREVIMKMHVPLNGPPDEPAILHNLTRRNPRGIALDLCNRHIYWVNSNISNASIERSNLDGSDRMIVANESFYMPLAVAVDHAMNKLYWIDDVQGLPHRIERSNPDGSGREMLVEFEYHHPVHLAVDHDSVYWTDLVHHAVWRMSKNEKRVPVIFQSYKYDTDPAGIVARDNVGKIDCAAMERIRQKTSLSNSTLSQPVESYNNLTTSTEESELTTETSKYCLNGGHVLEKEDNCQCKLGFTGPNCETDLCHNYCFHGTCAINSKGEPMCKCNETFVGPRCETNLCKDYCLHDGQCSIQNERPVCKCIYTGGSRCEILSNATELCKIFCTNSEPISISIASTNCRCTAEEEEEEEERTAQIVTFWENDEYRMLLPIFGAFVGVLILVIFVLSYYVNKFRRRPRIKKRFVVSKSGVMPLTSRPQVPDSQCEITIENCCNMNICETPCFEPKLRTATPAPNGNKKEEKSSLLDNMEGNSW